MRLSVLMLLVMVGISGGIMVPNVSASEPDFEIKTTKDILKFCEFFYDEYVTLGVETLTENHPNYPNLRACVILYEHIAWKSTHPLRDQVLIAEIEKYMGDSKDVKERHLRNSSTMPEWIKKM